MLFRTVLAHPLRPDAYLFVVAPEKTGRIDISSPFWKPASVQVVSFSEDSDQQQAMLLMPAYSWVHGRTWDILRGAVGPPAVVGAAHDGPGCLNGKAPMRHTKGSIVLSETQDHPILRQILACGFVTHDQLFRFMQLSLHERSRNSYNNRIRRLVKHNVVVEGYSPLVPGSRYYSIPTATAVILAGRGPLYVGAITGLEKRRETDALAHAIELNDIHLALAGSGRLIRWKPEVEIRAQNERTDFGHPKDYDAVVTLEGPAGETRFALEYERTPKREPQYVEIQRKLATETRVACVLYLAPSHYALSRISKWFRQTGPTVVFGVASEFCQDLLDTRVTGPAYRFPVPLNSVLR